MMFIVFILLIFIGMFLKKSKCYEILIILFIAIMTYYGENIADLENYQRAYNYIAVGNYYNDLGKGWYYLCNIGAKLNLEYIQFKTILVVLAILLINSTVKYFIKDNNHKTMIFALYLIFPALLDCIQIRFFIAEAIVLFSFRFLLSNKKRCTIVYIVCVVLASTIHSSVLLYLIFVLYKVLGKYESKYIAIMSAIMMIFLIGKKYIIKLCSLFINQQRINRYFYSTDTLGIKGLVIYIAIIVVFYYFAQAMLRKSKSMEFEKEEINFFEFISKLNILISIALVFSVFDPNFFRLQRIMWILMYIGVAKMLNKDIKEIVLFNIKMPIKLLSSILAIFGNLIFITVTTPEIITAFLF